MASRATRRTVIPLRVDEPRLALIDRAAKAVGRTRSDFVLDAATDEATSVLLNRYFFAVDARRFERFVAVLDAAPADNPRLRALLAQTAPWHQ